MPQGQIKVVFLDIDNTILSFTGYVKQAMRDGFARFGLKPYDESMYPVFEQVNNGLWRQLERGELDFGELIRIRWARVFQALEIEGDGPAFEEYFRGQLFTSAIPEPGAIALLELLHGKYILCVASNGPYKQQMNRLRLAGMDKYFDFFFISAQIGASKPSREFFDYCFRKLREERLPDLNPEETIIIGDSMTSDIAGGAAYGMHTCLYLPMATGEGNPDAETVIGDLREIQRILP